MLYKIWCLYAAALTVFLFLAAQGSRSLVLFTLAVAMLLVTCITLRPSSG